MRTTLRDVGLVATVAAIVLVALPATVLAECNGPACGEADQALDTLGVVFLVVVLTIFVAVMTVGGRVVRKTRRSSN